MGLEQENYRRWERERDSLRQQITDMEAGEFTTRFDAADPRKDTTRQSIDEARAKLKEIERLLADRDDWKPRK